MLCGLALPSLASAQALGLSDAIERAVRNHPDVAVASTDVDASQARESGSKSAWGPKLSAGADVQVWNEAQSFSFTGGGANLPAPTTPYEEVINGFLNSGPVTIRDQVTWSASLTLAQPLTPLWDVYLANQLTKSSTDVAQRQVTATQRRVQRDVVEAFLRVNQAKKQLATAQESVTQLEAQVARLTNLVELGAAQDADRLRIEVALAAAKQQAFRAEADLNLARAAFSVALGEEDGADLDAQVLDVGTLLPPAQSLQSMVDEAMTGREELRNLDDQVTQAELNVELKRSSYKPDVVALAQYQHTAGQGLAGSDTFFVGASLKWTIFEWGATSATVDEADATVLKVQISKTQAKRQIALQVRKAYYDYEASRKGFDVAAAAVSGAEEAFRVENERFEAGRSTPTDLLAAQTALTEARNNRDAAYYQGLVNRAELIWATGRVLSARNIVEGVQE
ncbi:MAG: TolC family protein [bacterium]